LLNVAVLVFADHHHDDSASARVAALARTIHDVRAGTADTHDDLVSLLVELGAVEAGIADALQPDEETTHPVLVALRQASEALGLAVAASWSGRQAPHDALQPAADALSRLTSAALPGSVSIRTAEGYAFYTLYPEAYVEAMTGLLEERRPAAILCLGLRTIGTSLSAVVHGAATLARVPAVSWTLRPRGHPFDRHVAIATGLARRWPLDRALVVIVDEGPGLSGSSLAGAAEGLSRLGVPDDRIVLLAAWQPDVRQLRSAAARERWSRHTVLTASFARVRRRVLAAIGVPPDAVDLSGGRWRSILRCPEPWPATHPQHERTKLLAPDGRLVRFAGRGACGVMARARAERLAAAGWTAAPGALRLGFLESALVPGRPLRAYDDEALCRAARYIGWLRRHEATTCAAATDRLAEMLLVNARMALGDDAARAAARLADDARRFSEPAVAIDGRLQPHEWVLGPGGLVKTDALDHHRDHFLPGPTDAAWDLAALGVEGRLIDEARARVLDAYVRASGDAAVAHRLPFHLAAYAALRVGYCTLAEPVVDEEERRRFVEARTRYLAALRSALAIDPGSATAAVPA
jgi:hypothetical protein